MSSRQDFGASHTRGLAAIIVMCVALIVIGSTLVYRQAGQLIEHQVQVSAHHLAARLAEHLTDRQGKGPQPAGGKGDLHPGDGAGGVIAYKVIDNSGTVRLSWRRPSSGVAKPARALLYNAGAGAVRTVTVPIRTAGGEAATVQVEVNPAAGGVVGAAREIGLIIALMVIASFAIGYLFRANRTRTATRMLAQAWRNDPLTGLANRDGFLEVAREVAKKAGAGRLAVVVGDIDSFFAINESFGHAAGDEVLRTIAKALRGLCGGQAQAARIGGDNFALMMPLANDQDAGEAGAIMLAAMSQSINWQGETIAPKVSVGVVASEYGQADATDLLSLADLARYAAKQRGGGQVHVYSAETERHLTRQRDIESAIMRALERDGFELHYQPLYGLSDNTLTSFEALIRLNDEKLGDISPADFVPVAERMGKISAIGVWALNEACAMAASWPDSISVAVNLSPIQFESGNLVDQVTQALASSGLAAERLEIEVTEGLLLRDSQLIRGQLHRLQAMGIRIVLDDFGSGYSSLNYLWRFPFDKIKIDGSFVRAMDNDKRAEGVLRAIIGLGRSLGLPVTAEGVENESQASFLRRLGCDLVQGYLFAKPMPASEVAGAVLANFIATRQISAAMPQRANA